jgi:hypothetical protein
MVHGWKLEKVATDNKLNTPEGSVIITCGRSNDAQLVESVSVKH